MEFKKHDLFNHFKLVHKRKFAQRNFVVGFMGKKATTMEHYRLKESVLNFDEVAEADKNFSFANLEAARASRSSREAQDDLDYITKQNLKDFEKDMKDEIPEEKKND